MTNVVAESAPVVASSQADSQSVSQFQVIMRASVAVAVITLHHSMVPL